MSHCTPCLTPLSFLKTITNADGQFSFDHANSTGHECLKVSAIGYITAFVSPVKSKQTVQMQSNEYALNEVVVSGKRDIFKSRASISSPTSSTHVCVILALLMIYSTSCPWSQERKEIIKSLGKALPLSMWAIESLIDPSELSRIATKDIATIEVISNPEPNTMPTLTLSSK